MSRHKVQFVEMKLSIQVKIVMMVIPVTLMDVRTSAQFLVVEMV